MEEADKESILKAVMEDRADIISKFISSGSAKIGEVCLDDFGNTALHLASKHGKISVLRTLLKSNVECNRANDSGEFPFSMAESEEVSKVFNLELIQLASAGDSDRVHRLISSGVDPNCNDGSPDAATPLHWAATYGHLEAIEVLLKSKASVNAQTKESLSTPAHEAAKGNHVEALVLLRDAGADLTLRDSSGRIVPEMIEIPTTTKKTAYKLPAVPTSGPDFRRMLEERDQLIQSLRVSMDQLLEESGFALLIQSLREEVDNLKRDKIEMEREVEMLETQNTELKRRIEYEVNPNDTEGLLQERNHYATLLVEEKDARMQDARRYQARIMQLRPETPISQQDEPEEEVSFLGGIVDAIFGVEYEYVDSESE